MLLQQCQNVASPAMVKDGLQPLLSGAQARFSSSAFNWVASSIHSAVQNKVHRTAGLREQSFFGYVSGVSELQSSGQHLEHCLLMLP